MHETYCVHQPEFSQFCRLYVFVVLDKAIFGRLYYQIHFDSNVYTNKKYHQEIKPERDKKLPSTFRNCMHCLNNLPNIYIVSNVLLNLVFCVYVSG